MKIRKQFDPSYKGQTYEPADGWEPSQTEPDMHLTIRELVENHARGINSNVHMYQAHYFEDQEIPTDLDLVDIKERRAELDALRDDLEAKSTKVPENKENPSETVKTPSNETSSPETEG